MRLVKPNHDVPHHLVTGGAGFIGSHVVDRLLETGAKVTVVDDLSSGALSNLPSHPKLWLIKKDLARLGAEDLTDAPDSIAHLAAIPSVAYSWDAPSQSHDANLSNTLKVIELAKTWGCPRIVFASSAAVYGDVHSVPTAEECPTHPISPYGLHKLCSEDYLELFARQSGLECIALRLFNVYGPRQRADSEYSGVITRFVRAVTAGEDICIEGDGKQTRDFVSVQDVAHVFSLALTHPMDRGAMVRCNVGSGNAVSIDALAKHLSQGLSSGSGVLYADARPGDIRHSCADVAQLKSWLGYQPQGAWRDGILSLLDYEHARIAGDAVDSDSSNLAPSLAERHKIVPGATSL